MLKRGANSGNEEDQSYFQGVSRLAATLGKQANNLGKVESCRYCMQTCGQYMCQAVFPTMVGRRTNSDNPVPAQFKKLLFVTCALEGPLFGDALRARLLELCRLYWAPWQQLRPLNFTNPLPMQILTAHSWLNSHQHRSKNLIRSNRNLKQTHLFISDFLTTPYPETI